MLKSIKGFESKTSNPFIYKLYMILVTPTGIEPMIPPWEGGVLAAWPRGHNQYLLFIPQIVGFRQ